MKLEVGEFYLSASGEIIKIDWFNTETFEDNSSNTYFENGKCDGDCREFDLIAEIPKELHQYLIQTIKDYHTDSDFKNVINNVFGDK